tara:strand:- start:5528 stop:5782 length:255 start_codon:yes stop_codon:yes gene_type:complete
MHSLTQNGVTKWVALSEGAGGGVGWLTVRRKRPAACPGPTSDAPFARPQTNERKEVRCRQRCRQRCLRLHALSPAYCCRLCVFK